MIWGLVLAGGRSTRMGRDKATLVVGGNGERLVDRVVAAATGALRAAGERAPRVLVSGAVEGHECVLDATAGLGPVAGIAAALDLALGGRARPTHLLALPVDLPNVTAGALAPLMGIQGMVTRKGWNGEVWGENQKINVAEAIRIYTLNGAHCSFEEQLKGSITPGKLADYVVLASDPHTVDPNTIKDIKIVRTVTAG